MNIEEKFTLIEKYLAGDLAGTALADFEKQIKENPELQEEVTLHRQLAETLRGEKIHQLRNVLNDTDQKWQPPSKATTGKVIDIRWRRILSVAAVVLLVAIGWYWFFSSNPLSNEALYAQHFEAYPMVLNQRSFPAGNENTALLHEIVNNYNQQNYTVAGEALQNFQATQPDNIALQFYVGVTFLADGKSELAIPVLEKVVQQPGHLFVEQSRWYLALAYLDQGNTNQAKTELTSIQEGHFQYTEAQQILEQMN